MVLEVCRLRRYVIRSRKQVPGRIGKAAEGWRRKAGPEKTLQEYGRQVLKVDHRGGGLQLHVLFAVCADIRQLVRSRLIWAVACCSMQSLYIVCRLSMAERMAAKIGVNQETDALHETLNAGWLAAEQPYGALGQASTVVSSHGFTHTASAFHAGDH